MNHKYCLAALLGLLFTTSCSDFLDLTPISEASSGNYYKNASDIESALSGCYSALQDNELYGERLNAMTELRSDNIEDINPGGSGGIFYFIDKFTVTSGNDVIRSVWKGLYNQIYRCNNVLAFSHVIADEGLRRRYEGEASFLRALAYFNVVRLWGDAPLILEPISAQDAVKYGRDPVIEIYAAIEDDLKQAMDKLEPTLPDDELGRATSVAAAALLGKVYLTEQKWPEAVDLLDGLISAHGSQYGLLEHVADVFSVDNEMNKEILFAVRWSKSIVGEGHSAYNDYHEKQLELRRMNPNDPDYEKTQAASDKALKKYTDSMVKLSQKELSAQIDRMEKDGTPPEQIEAVKSQLKVLKRGYQSEAVVDQVVNEKVAGLGTMESDKNFYNALLANINKRNMSH